MIKKLLLLLILIASIHTTATAQKNKFGWGAKVGFNISSLRSHIPEYNKLFSYKGDIVIGVFADYRVIKWLSVTTEFLYSGQGFKSTGVEEEYADISYLNLPILLNFHITKGLAFKSGIQFGYAFSLRFRTVYSAEIDNGIDTLQPWSYSIPIGVSYTLESGFVFDFRYAYDIRSILQDVNSRNSVFSVTLGLRF